MAGGEELAPQYKGRPAVVKMGTWTVYLGVHDWAYMLELRRYKRQLRDAHPDKGGTSAKFRAVLAAKRKWHAQECQWYASLGLLPPDGAKLGEAKQQQLRKRLNGEKSNGKG